MPKPRGKGKAETRKMLHFWTFENGICVVRLDCWILVDVDEAVHARIQGRCEGSRSVQMGITRADTCRQANISKCSAEQMSRRHTTLLLHILRSKHHLLRCIALGSRSTLTALLTAFLPLLPLFGVGVGVPSPPPARLRFGVATLLLLPPPPSLPLALLLSFFMAL